MRCLYKYFEADRLFFGYLEFGKGYFIRPSKMAIFTIYVLLYGIL